MRRIKINTFGLVIAALGLVVLYTSYYNNVHNSDSWIATSGEENDTDIPVDREYNGIITTLNSTKHEDHKNKDEHARISRNVVVAMSVCCSFGSQDKASNGLAAAQHDHGKKPYQLAAVLATQLWKQTYDKHLRVVVVLAHLNTSESMDELKHITTLIKQAGGIPIPYLVSEHSDLNTACVRAAQLSRMYIHEITDILNPSDYVITSDVDLFPINATRTLQDFARKKQKNGDYYRIWMMQHGHAMKTKESIPMALVGQSAADWKKGMEIINVDLDMAIALSLTPKVWAWGFDQLLLTGSILNRRLCNFPKEYVRMWKDKCSKGEIVVSLDPNQDSSADDSGICLKSFIPVCSVMPADTSKGCIGMHFYPQDGLEQLQLMYDAIARLYPGHIKSSEVIQLRNAS